MSSSHVNALNSFLLTSQKLRHTCQIVIFQFIRTLYRRLLLLDYYSYLRYFHTSFLLWSGNEAHLKFE